MRLPGPPLYPVLAYLWSGVLGDHELIVRLPSLIFGLGSIVLTYLIAGRFGRGGMPFLAALFLCLSPTHIWYSQEATPYAMSMFFLLAAVFVWPRVTAPAASWKDFALYLTMVVTASFTHFYAAVCLVPFTVLGLMTAREIRHRILLINGLAVLALAVWLAIRYAHRGDLPTPPGFVRAFTAFEWWMLFFQWFLDGNSLWSIAPDRMTPDYLLAEPWLLAIQIGFAILVIRALRPAPEESGLVPAELVLHLCTLPLAVYLLTLVFRQQLYIERYLIICLPIFAIAIARGATRFSSATVRTAMVCTVIAVSVASTAAFLQKDGQWTVFRPNPDWQSAARFLASQNEGPQHLLLLGGVQLADFMFYLSKQWPEPQPRVLEYTPQRLERYRRDGRAVQIVLVRNPFWKGDIDAKVARFQRNPRLEFTTLTSFKAVDLLTFVPRDGAVAVSR